MDNIVINIESKRNSHPFIFIKGLMMRFTVFCKKELSVILGIDGFNVSFVSLERMQVSL